MTWSQPCLFMHNTCLFIRFSIIGLKAKNINCFAINQLTLLLQALNGNFFQPENVVCTHKQDTNIKIIDFGLAKHMEPEDKVGYFLSVLRIRIREDPN